MPPYLTIASSPWGPVQVETITTEGVIFVSTASHGGFWVSDERLLEMPSAIREFPNHAGKNWFEEDCDAVLVYLAFPHLFDDRAAYHAIDAAKTHAKNFGKHYATLWEKLQKTDHYRENLEPRATAWFEEHKHLYEQGSMGSCKEGWEVSFRRLDGEDRFWVKVSMNNLRDLPRPCAIEQIQAVALSPLQRDPLGD